MRTKPQTRQTIGSRALLMLIPLALSGCVSVGPDYHAPAPDINSNWQTPNATQSTQNEYDEMLLSEWWAVFADPNLVELIRLAKSDNRDLRQALARVREARAQRGLSKASLGPNLQAEHSARRSTSSAETGIRNTADSYSLGLDASWELDLFGKKRRDLEAADATLDASREEWRDVQVTLYAEVALAYVEYRNYQNRLALTESNLAAQQETYELTRWRREAGLTTQLDVDQAKLSLEQTRADLPVLRINRDQAANRISLLTGQNPGSAQQFLTAEADVPVAVVEISSGLPADLLRRRPDIRRRERELAAQTARIGSAAAERYPSFTLSGSLGLEALQYANLYSGAARVAQGVISSGWTLFDGGRIKRNVEIQSAKQEQALAVYESTVLTAQQEVENALVGYAEQQNRQASLEAAEQAAKSVLELARAQYSSGLIDFQTVLDAQRSLLSVQNQLATTSADATSNLIRLYKALGGGWRFDDSLHPTTNVEGMAGTLQSTQLGESILPEIPDFEQVDFHSKLTVIP